MIQKGFVERFEIEQREKWEIARWQTFLLLQPSVKQNSLKAPKDLILFPWEKEIKTDLLQLHRDGVFDIFPNKL